VQDFRVVEMTKANLTHILGRLERAGIDAWLDGGWGVDALLGVQTRPHDDVDLIVQVIDVPAMREALSGDGFLLDHGAPDSNFVLRDPDGREIDVHPIRFDEGRNGIYRMENGEDWVYPAAGFVGRGRIAGREVKCLTADVQMLCHAGGYEPAETDFHDMRLLNTRFGTPLLPPYRTP
jgi:lincosamide nucleotidyltransferase A/C/D/E